MLPTVILIASPPRVGQASVTVTDRTPYEPRKLADSTRKEQHGDPVHVAHVSCSAACYWWVPHGRPERRPRRPDRKQSVVTARGSVGWFHDGDKVQVCDAKADGLSIEANYRLAGDTTPGRVLHVAGAGNCDSLVWDKTEGANIQIRMCYRDGFVITKCSDWQAAEA